MITLTDKEAKEIELAINLGQISFIREEGLEEMGTEEANAYLEDDSPTKRLLMSILKGRWVILNKIEAERNKDQSPVADRFEILDL